MQNDYATGKKVYNGGLPNAHSGTLDPSGYIKRESERRSGLAAIAMARRGNNGGPQAPGSKPTKRTFNENGLYVSPIGKIGRLG